MNTNHIAKFTRGSKWRFTKDVYQTRRDRSGSHRSYGSAKAGDIIEVVGHFNHLTLEIPIKGARFLFATSTSLKKTGPDATGTALHNCIWRHVERVDAGTKPVLFYIRYHGTNTDRFYRGQFDDFPHVDSFTEAQFFTSQTAAIKAMMRLANFRKWQQFSPEGYSVWSYNAVKDQHERVHICAHVIAALKAVNNVAGMIDSSKLDLAMSDIIKRADRIVLGEISRGDAVTPFTVRERIVRDLIDRHGFKVGNLYGPMVMFDNVDDAVLTKMSVPFEFKVAEFA